jgi:hypothetical protein
MGALKEAHLMAVCEKDVEIFLSEEMVNCWRTMIF